MKLLLEWLSFARWFVETSLFADGGSVGSCIGTGQLATKTFVKYKSATADKFITRKHK